MLNLSEIQTPNASGLTGCESTFTQSKSKHVKGLCSEQLIEISKMKLKDSNQQIEISNSEKLKKRIVSVIESPVTLGIIGSTYLSALASSLAASVLDFLTINTNNCPRPLVPLILDVASAVVSLLSGAMEILGAALTGDEKIRLREDILVDNFVEALKNRQKRASNSDSPGRQEDQVKALQTEIEKCIDCFDALPQHLKNELPPAEQWTMWLLNTIPHDHPLKKSQEVLPNSALKKESSLDSIGLVEKIIREATISFTSSKKSSSKGQADIVIEIPGDELLKLNREKLAEGLKKEDPEKLKIRYIQAQARRLKELEAGKSEAQEYKQVDNCCTRVLKSKQRRFAQHIMFAFSILLTGASSITDLVLNNDDDCERPVSVLAISGASIGLLSLVTFVWITYLGLKANVEEQRHDERLIEKFLKAVEEHAQTARKCKSDQIECLHEKIKNCLSLFDALPEEVKKNIPQRDLWILGLLNALPENHPIKQDVQNLSAQLRPRRKTISKEPANLVRTTDLQKQFESLFLKIEALIGGPINYIAVGQFCVTREYQIKKLEELVNIDIHTQSSDGFTSGVTIGMQL